MNISKEIKQKIDYLCQKINKVEWSGVLFYSVKGKIKNFDSIEMTIEDIFPMDKGTAGSTGYELGDEIIDYRMSNPQSLGWKMGMVHSHHDMNSYFSGVDMSELDDNTEFHNYYLSLVVNNKGEMVAKVAFRGDVKGYECLDENGEPWNLTLTKDRQVMFTFDCKIHSPDSEISVPGDFEQRVSQVIKESDKKRYQVTKEKEKFNNRRTSIVPKQLTLDQIPVKSGQYDRWKDEQKIRRKWFYA